MDKIRVALLCGGKSAEREVSLNSGAEVLAHLDQGRFTATSYDPATDIPRLAEDAQAGRLDVAFLALHGPLGEDGTVQGLMELLGLPYTGSGVLASALAMDKEAAKTVFRGAGLPVAPDMVVTRAGASGEPDLARMAFHTLGSPLVVKPVRLGSSVGLSIVRHEEELTAALTRVFDWAARPFWKNTCRARNSPVVWSVQPPTSRPCPSLRSSPPPGTPFSIIRPNTSPARARRSARPAFPRK